MIENPEHIRALLYPLGLIASLLFGLRFLIQWIQSEKQKASHVRPLFWKISIIANLILMTHSLIQVNFFVYFSQSLLSLLSWRNLNLHKPLDKRIRFKTMCITLLCAACISLCIFIIFQKFFYQSSRIEWIKKSPFIFSKSMNELSLSSYIHVFGFFAVFLFSLRFWVQWWYAEREQKSHLHKIFWQMSVIGGSFSLIYFFVLQDIVNFIGPLLAMIPYARNLKLIKKGIMANQNSDNFFIFAGETSADLFGSKVLQHLQNDNESMNFWGVGGPLLCENGLKSLIPMHEFQMMGFSQVFSRLPQVVRNFMKLKNAILESNPKIVFFIDQPAFGIRLAKALRKKGFSGKIVQFVAPTVWAYNPKRASIMAEHFDLLLTLFSFEPKYFEKEGLKTVFVGHPVLELIGNPNTMTKEHQTLAIFPGSRPEEVERNLPKQLFAAIEFCKKNPEVKIAVSLSSPEMYERTSKFIRQLRHKTGYSEPIDLVPFSKRYELMNSCTFALAKSGTVTLELALFGIPTIVTYDVSKLNRFIATYVLRLKIPYFSLVNILLQREVFAELIRPPCHAQEIYEKLNKLYPDAGYRTLCQEARLELIELLKTDKSPTLKVQEQISEILKTA